MARKSKLDPADWLEGGATEDDDSDVTTTASGIVVTKSRLSTITGLAPVTIDKAFKEGAPVISKGSKRLGWQINTADFFGWYVRAKVNDATVAEGAEGAVSFDVAKAAKTQAEAQLKQMQLARLEGQTITIDEAVALYREEASIVRSQLLAIPGRLAQALVTETDPSVIESIIADEVNVALQNITGDTHGKWTGEVADDGSDDAESDAV